MTSQKGKIRFFNLTRQTITNCGEGCDTPGVSSPNYDPYDSNCNRDCAMCCSPFTLIIDLIMLPIIPFRLLYKRFRRAPNTSVDEHSDSS